MILKTNYIDLNMGDELHNHYTVNVWEMVLMKDVLNILGCGLDELKSSSTVWKRFENISVFV